MKVFLILLFLFMAYQMFYVYEKFKDKKRRKNKRRRGRRRRRRRRRRKNRKKNKIPSDKKCSKLIKSMEGSSKGNIFDQELDTNDTIDGLKDVNSLAELKLKYKKYLKKECSSTANLGNPERCDAAKLYMKKMKKFIKNTKIDSENHSSKLRVLQDQRLSDGSYKDIYPINNYDFDYSTSMLKKYNVYKAGITNKPTGAALANSPKRIKKYIDVLIKNEFPDKKSESGVTDTITDDDIMQNIKMNYDTVNKNLPYPTFRMDYPECKYPISGKHSSSYFIRTGSCPTKITDEKVCEKKGYEWGSKSESITDKVKGVGSTAITSMTNSLSNSESSSSESSKCNKPRYMYIDNSAKGYYGKKGLAMSLFKDMEDLTPEKLTSIMDGYSVSGSGLLPCIDSDTDKPIIVGIEDEYASFYPEQDSIELE